MDIKERKVEYFYTPNKKSPFADWLRNLKDTLGEAIIRKRIKQASLGNFGNSKPLGNGVMEMKIKYGPGYRIYYGVHKDEIILLLFGGDKSSQSDDINKSKAYWTIWKENNNG